MKQIIIGLNPILYASYTNYNVYILVFKGQVMSCVSCNEYTNIYLCIDCGEILEPMSQNIQEYYQRLEKIASKSV